MTYPPQGPNQPVGPGDPTAPAWPAAAPDQRTQHIPRPPTATDAPTQYIPQPGPPSAPPPQEPEEPKSGFLRDPLSIILTLVIVVALVIAGLLGIELYVRHRADSVVARAVECVVKDKANVSFGMRPFVLQHLSGHYSNINVETAGNQIREAKGMKLNLVLDDIKIEKTADSAGTLGSLDATITWSSDGIKKTLQDIIPIVGGLVTGVTTSPSDGTIELRGRHRQHHGQAGGVQRQPESSGRQPQRAGLHAAAGNGAAGSRRVHHRADQEPADGYSRRQRGGDRHRGDGEVRHPRRDDSQRSDRSLLRGPV